MEIIAIALLLIGGLVAFDAAALAFGEDTRELETTYGIR